MWVRFLKGKKQREKSLHNFFYKVLNNNYKKVYEKQELKREGKTKNNLINK